MKSKIDQSDPNPAHKLRNKVEDLIIEEGKEINPRFSNRRNFYKRSDTDSWDHFPKSSDRREKYLAKYRQQRASSLDSFQPRSEFSSALPFKRDTRSGRMTTFAQNRLPMKTSPLQNDIFEEIEEESVSNSIPVNTELSTGPICSKAFMENSCVTDGESKSTDSANIYDIEVTNSPSETTVVLKHLLALSGKRKSSLPSQSNASMTIIEEDEEDEEEYYESEDTVPSVTPIIYRLPHPIPRLIITDEIDGLVETVIEKARELNTVEVVNSNNNVKSAVNNSLELVMEELDTYPVTRL